MEPVIVFLKRWIEVWPFIIPLSIFLFSRKNNYSVFLFVFTLTAFVISLLANLIWQYSYLFPKNFRNNNILYNAGSIMRSVFPALYLLSIESVKPMRFLRYLLYGYFIFLLINFIFFDNIFYLSTAQHSAESILILIFSISFFLHLIIDDEADYKTVKPALFFSMGIGLYESINFFIYLFFYPVLNSDYNFATTIYDASQYSFILYWVMTGLAIYFHTRQPVHKISSAS